MPISDWNRLCLSIHSLSRKCLQELKRFLTTPNSRQSRTHREWFSTQPLVNSKCLFFATRLSNSVFWWGGKRILMSNARTPCAQNCEHRNMVRKINSWNQVDGAKWFQINNPVLTELHISLLQPGENLCYSEDIFPWLDVRTRHVQGHS